MAALPDKLKLEVATPLGLKLSVTCTSVEAASVEGYFDVLPGHIPMLAALRGGLLKYTEGGQTKIAAIGSGFVEVEPDSVRILTDAFTLPKDVDTSAVERQRTALNEKLKAYGDDTTLAAYQELTKQADWLEAQLDAVKTTA